jgi:hypothetical protein
MLSLNADSSLLVPVMPKRGQYTVGFLLTVRPGHGRTSKSFSDNPILSSFLTVADLEIDRRTARRSAMAAMAAMARARAG